MPSKKLCEEKIEKSPPFVSSVPEYCVEEDKRGRLVNREKRLIWPSKKQYLKADFDEGLITPTVDETSIRSIQSSEPTDIDAVPVRSTVESESFIGGATSAEAELRIGYRSFVLYYRMPDDGSIPLAMPLMLVYRSTHNVHYHFTISQRKQYEANGTVARTFYKVECGDSLDFLSLDTLIRHYETFVYHDIYTGVMETFPVGWKDGALFDVHK